MNRLMLKRFLITSVNNDLTKRNGKRSLFVNHVNREKVIGGNITINPEIITLDRPNTDNLLLSPETRDKKTEPANLTPKTTEKAQDVQKIDNMMKSNLTEQLQDSLVRTPRENQVALTTTKKVEHAVPFDEVPGPVSLKLVSNLMKYIPVIGMQTVSSLLQGVNHLLLSYGNNIFITRTIRPFKFMFDTYGDIVCLRIPFCGDIVMVHKPEHISEIYKQRNAQSMTLSSFDSLIEWNSKQSKNRFDKHDNIWEAFNEQCSKYTVFKELVDEKVVHAFSKPVITLSQDLKDLFKDNFEAKKLFWSNTKYHSTIEKTSDDFLKRIYSIRSVHDEVPSDFQNELYMWGIECMMQTLFATNMGFYETSEIQTTDAQRMLRAFLDASDALQTCEGGLQLWRVFNTRSWNKLTHSCEVLESVLGKHMRMSKLRLDIALKMMMDNKNIDESTRIIKSSLVKALILSGCVQPEQILALCLDMMLVGVNASSMSLGFLFYHLAKHPKVQQKLYNEVLHILPEKNSVIQLEHVRDAPFLNGCITESLRLKHPIPYSLMCLPKTIILNKYRIPAGTYVMTANEISCLQEENFEEAYRFKPERWVNKSNERLHNVGVPLTEDTRAFLGRDWLNQQLAVATAKIVRNFEIGYNYGEIKKTRKIFVQPNKPFKFTFTER